MSLWDLINFNKVDEGKIANAIESGETPTISSSKEMEIYLKYKIKDEQFAKIFSEILDKIGRDGIIEIKEGGEGNPYQVEYVSSGFRSKMRKKEVKEQKMEITKRMENSHLLTEQQIQELQKEITQITDSHAIIWVNSRNHEEFVIKELLFSETVSAVEEAFRKYRRK